ncbi:MAG: DUF2807 domain-containing protein [Saprospiraceae bacterium]|nr:DUF2807 domain-containing protein [Saprospiraceae bacterium]
MKTKTALFVLSIVLIFSSCQKEDLGAIVNVRIELPSFDQIRHDAKFDIVLLQGAKQSIEFEGHELILAETDIRVVNRKLIVSQRGHYWSTGKSTLYIVLPDLSSIETTSSGDIYSQGRFTLNGPLALAIESSGDIDLDIDLARLYTTIDGSGDLRLRGYADNHNIEINGSGNVYAFFLDSYNVRIDHYGFGNAEIHAQRDLFVRLRSNGHIYFTGRPFLTYSVTGSGRLIDAN